MPQFLLDVEAEWHRALVLLAVFCMVTTKCDELLADRTTAIGFTLAAFGMLNYTFHFLARWKRAVGIAALAGMHQRLDAPLNTETP